MENLINDDLKVHLMMKIYKMYSHIFNIQY